MQCHIPSLTPLFNINLTSLQHALNSHLVNQDSRLDLIRGLSTSPLSASCHAHVSKLLTFPPFPSVF